MPTHFFFWIDLRGAVAQWIVHWLLVLEVPGLIPAGGEDYSVTEHASLVPCRDDMSTVCRPSDQDVTVQSGNIAHLRYFMPGLTSNINPD